MPWAKGCCGAQCVVWLHAHFMQTNQAVTSGQATGAGGGGGSLWWGSEGGGVE